MLWWLEMTNDNRWMTINKQDNSSNNVEIRTETVQLFFCKTTRVKLQVFYLSFRLLPDTACLFELIKSEIIVPAKFSRGQQAHQ